MTVQIVPLKSGGRADWMVTTPPDNPSALDHPQWVTAFRRFLADFDDEITARAGDPVQTGTALARFDALMADIRYLQSRLRTVTAEAMAAQKVRRIVVEGVGVWEASSTVDRTGWQTARLVAAYLDAAGVVSAVNSDGEFVTVEDVANLVADLYGPSTAPRVTPLREVGLDPDRFCTVPTDETGGYLRTPAVRVQANDLRKR